MENVQNFYNNDKFSAHVGIELLDFGPGMARARMKIEEHHLNSVNIVHGAAIFSLADLVFAIASNSHGTVSVAINVSISFLKAVEKGFLYAEGKEVSRNPKLASYTIHVTDEGGELVAVFQGMVYRKKEKI